MFQALHLFGYLPNMLEWSVNPCFQGCDYCYAKMWKRENEPIEKFINFVLRQENKKEGLLPFLIRKRSPITISNRTDIMCAPDWRERLQAIKKLGFPVYIETKLNKNYKDLVEILDKEKDTVYQTITGYNNKYEEKNILSAEEKIEAAKYLNGKGIHHYLAINPYLQDKVTPDEIKKMIDYIQPHGVIMRDYHKPSSGLAKKYFMAEYPKAECKAGRDIIRAYCRKKGIDHDIDAFGDDGYYASNNLRKTSNHRSFNGNHFVKQDLAIYMQKIMDDKKIPGSFITFDGALRFWEKQIDFFNDCIIKPGDYNINTGASYKPQTGNIGIVDFLRTLWNNNKWMEEIAESYKKPDKELYSSAGFPDGTQNGNSVFFIPNMNMTDEEYKKALS
ncbi:MAG: radical SAM protein [Spirochaetaceae bacterium]|jgi:DNA repair photolyase|nr:radical SAM protein [Spirochaetaceae bacterium]